MTARWFWTGLCALAAIGCAAATLPVTRTVAPAKNASICARLAGTARALPASAWSKGYKALGPELDLARDETSSPIGAAVVASPRVKAALGDQDGTYRISVQRLPGTDVYMASMIAGTLDCQTPTFVRATSPRRFRLIRAPRAWGEGDLCWTGSLNAGRAAGQPALVQIDSYDSSQPAADNLEITPWAGAGWAEACDLSVVYRAEFAVSERFCGDARICEDAAKLAPRIAKAHLQWSSKSPFRFGPAPSAAGQAAFDLAAKSLPASPNTPDFPTFGATPKTEFPDFSYGEDDPFPLTLRGVTYLAVAGIGGVGWREIGDDLLAVYAIDDGKLRPLAGIVVKRSVTGMASVDVSHPKPRHNNP
jgi:hypothetical protein